MKKPSRAVLVAFVVGSWFGSAFRLVDAWAQQAPSYMRTDQPRAGQTLKFYPVARVDASVTSPATYALTGGCIWDTVQDCLTCYHGDGGLMCVAARGAGDASVRLNGPDGGVPYIINRNNLEAEAAFQYNKTDNRLRITSALTSTAFAGNIVLDLASAASGRVASLKGHDGTNQAMFMSYVNGASAPRWAFGGSSEVLTVLNSGNVGVNKTAPGAKLHVVGSASPGDGLIIQGSASSAPEGRIVDSGNNILGRLCGSQASGDCSTTAVANDFNVQSGGTTIPIVFGPTIGEWGRFAATTGYFGVGTASPGSIIEARVDTNGTTRVQVTNATNGTSAIPQMRAASTTEGVSMSYIPAASTLLSGIADAGLIRSDSTLSGGLWIDASGVLPLYLATNDVARVYVLGNGDVGIGATATEELHLTRNQNGVTRFRIDNTTSGTGAQASAYIKSDVGGVSLNSYSTGYSTALAGMDLPLGILMRSDSTQTAGIVIDTAAGPIVLATADTTRVTVTAAGNVTFAGDITVSGGDIISPATLNFAAAASTALNIGNATGPVTIAGVIRAQGGAVGDPGIAWTADADGTGTGFFRSAANNINTAINGAQTLQFTSNNLILGDLDAQTTARSATSVRAPNVATGGAGNVAGAGFDIATGKGTGTGTPGTLTVTTYDYAATGDNAQTGVTRATFGNYRATAIFKSDGTTPMSTPLRLHASAGTLFEISPTSSVWHISAKTDTWLEAANLYHDDGGNYRGTNSNRRGIGIEYSSTSTTTTTAYMRVIQAAAPGASGGTVTPAELLRVDATGIKASVIAQDFKGADVASASTITATGNFQIVTGTTTVNYLTTTNIQAGTTVCMEFSGALTLTHNAGSVPASTAAFYLAGAANFSSTADDILCVVYNGTVFKEKSRSVN